MKSFRIRFVLSKRAAIGSAEISLPLHTDEAGREVVLRATAKDKTIKDDDNLVVLGSGWDSEEAARAAADKYRDALIYSLSRTRVGSDLGDRAAKGWLTKVALQKMTEAGERPVVNDEHGVMVYDTDPTPLFARMGNPNLQLGARPETFAQEFTYAVSHDISLTPAERLAFEFFSASYFTNYEDARFILLFMGVEALIEQKERSPEVLRVVDRIEAEAKSAPEITQEERESLLGSIRWLRVESIRQSGRKLSDLCGGGEYSGLEAEELFLKAYDVRNRLVHGHSPPPARQEVGAVAAPLEVMLSELICASAERHRA